MALPKHRPHLARWVREFLVFASDHPGYTFKQTLDLFLSSLGGRPGTTAWQIAKAASALRAVQPDRLAKGAFQDACCLRARRGEPSAIVAIRWDGEVVRLDRVQK